MTGRDELLARVRDKTASAKAKAKLLTRAKNVVVKGAFGLGAVGTTVGAAKAVGGEKNREHAPPTIVPPGY